jgi:hypothetical protein
MKTIFVLCVLFVSLLACKKNKDKDNENKPKTILLSTSLTNGHIANRFYYSADNKFTKLELYDEQAPNALIGSIVFEYNQAGFFSRYTTYTEPGHAASLRLLVDSTNNGNIIKVSQYDLLSATPNVPITIQTRNYNGQGRLSKLENRDKNGKLINYTTISYYADGTVKQVDTYKEESNQLYLVEKRVYAVPGSLFPKGLQAIELILGFDYTAAFFNEAYQQYSYDQNGAITWNRQYQFSAREYNADSTLKKQTLTVKKIKPASADEVLFKQYEYITQ